MNLSFVDYLENRLSEAPPKQKGLRTRERLKLATAKVLEQRGYHAMRVIDITESAGVAEGSFYVYFKDKTEAAQTVLTALLEEFFPLLADAPPSGTPFDSIRYTNRQWIAVSRANSGLIRCILQLGDEIPEFSTLAQRTNRLWFERIAHRVTRQGSGLSARHALLLAYLLGAMMDELVRKLIIHPDPGLLALLGEIGAEDTLLADAASLIWLRILYPNAPAPVDLPDTAAILAEWIQADKVRDTPESAGR